MVTHMSVGLLNMVAWARKTGIRQSPTIQAVGWLEFPPYPTNGQRFGKSLRLRQNILSGVASGYRRGAFPGAGCRHTLKYPSAHELGKNDHLAHKKWPAGRGCRP